MDLRDMLAALRATWWMPILGGLLGGLLALTLSLLQTPRYTSSSQLFVSSVDASSAADALQGGQLSQLQATSYAELLKGDALAARVVNRLGLSLTPAQVSSEIQATAVTDTVLINVSVTDTSPVRAQRIADAVDTEFVAMASQLEATGGPGTAPIKVVVSDPPQVPTAPSSPQKTRNVALGLLAGVLVGSAVGIARKRLDGSVSSTAEASDLAGAPVIGMVQFDKALDKRHVIDWASRNRTAEDYRRLRTNLRSLDGEDPLKTILVSSAMPSEGKTTAVVNLALVLAEAGQRVTIVEADLRDPNVSRHLQVPEGPGLTDILQGNALIEDVIQACGENLSLITSGPLPPDPGELLATGDIRVVLEKLCSNNDVVLVDAPPLLPVADSAALALATDGVLLSVRFGRTQRGQLRQAAAELEAAGARALGVILNMVPPEVAQGAAKGYGRRARGGRHERPSSGM
jgi:capsular exopolysaccharide synthesis family protein